jgi:hypothetical protein
MQGASQYCGLPNLVGQSLFDNTSGAAVTAAGTAFGTIYGAMPNPSPSLGEFQIAMFELYVSAAAAVAGDTLDVYVQTSFDLQPTAASRWVDVVHFAQILGNVTPPKDYYDKIVANQPQAEFEAGSALAASAVRNLFGDAWRVKYVIVDGGAHGQSFNFAVKTSWK